MSQVPSADEMAQCSPASILGAAAGTNERFLLPILRSLCCAIERNQDLLAGGLSPAGRQCSGQNGHNPLADIAGGPFGPKGAVPKEWRVTALSITVSFETDGGAILLVCLGHL